MIVYITAQWPNIVMCVNTIRAVVLIGDCVNVVRRKRGVVVFIKYQTLEDKLNRRVKKHTRIDNGNSQVVFYQVISVNDC